MLEVPKTAWERRAPFVLASIVGLILIGAAGVWAWPHLARSSVAEQPAEAPPTIPEERAVAPTTPTDTAPQEEWIEWTADQGVSSYSIAGYQFRFSTRRGDFDLDAARMIVTSPTGASTTVDGVPWRGSAEFAVVQMDAASSARQILFSTFSGGAHCCSDLTMLEFVDGQWRRIDLGTWDGDVPRLPVDLDGDGRREFRFADQSFLYAFESYAGSWAPTLIYAVESGRVRDVSAERRFRPVHAAYLPAVREACEQRGNGACAAYVAAAARAGQLDQAWAVMLGAYDEYSTWTLPTACRIRTAESCPEYATVRFETYPEALQWFLGDTGYTDASYIAPYGATGPSYSCGAARQQSEHLICGDADLATLDRAMAALYTRAAALTANRTALRQSQREFLEYRDGLGDVASITAAYRVRINQLAAI